MAALLTLNPAKRKTKRKTVKKKAVRRAPSKRLAKSTTVKTYRRNPAPKLGGVVDTLKDGAIGAVGAVATELLLSKIPLPASLNSGNGRVAASALASVGVGMLVSKYGKQKAMGKAMARGGVTVALHSIIKAAVPASMGLGDSDYLMGSDGLMGYNSPSQTYDSSELDALYESDFDEYE